MGYCGSTKTLGFLGSASDLEPQQWAECSREMRPLTLHMSNPGVSQTAHPGGRVGKYFVAVINPWLLLLDCLGTHVGCV